MTTQSFKTIVLDLLRQGHLDEEAFVQGLDEAERNAIGTAKLWSAKDHFAHRTFWQRNLINRVTALLRGQEVAPSEEDEQQINARVFEENKLRPWSDVYAESERVSAEIIALVERLSEEDLTRSRRYRPTAEERPLYTVFLGPCYEHNQEHLAQYHADRHELERAIEIRERCVARVLQTEAPELVKGSFLYNLACFYAQQRRLERANGLLQEALTLAPGLREWSKSDPDLAVLRGQVG